MSLLSRVQTVWYGLFAATVGLLTLALLPPFVPTWMEVAIRKSFAPVCHQIVSRSPHVNEIPLAVCDRCIGIYLGFVLGVVLTGWGPSLWERLGTRGHYLLIGSVVPLGIDWVGPVLGLWSNIPVSRAATGLIFGVVVASWVTDQLLRRPSRFSFSGTPA